MCPAFRGMIDAQNSYAHALLDPQPMRPAISKRLTEMARHDTLGAPLLRSGFYFFMRRGAEEELWSIYRRNATGGPDELLIDSKPLSTDKASTSSQPPVGIANLVCGTICAG